MAEVITIYQITGTEATPTYNEATAIRFCADDIFNPGLTKPCKVPPVGITQYYSYWLTLCLHYSGDFSLINNARLWGPANIKDTWFPGSKGMMRAGRKDTGDHGFLVANYQQSKGTAGLQGYYLCDETNGHAEYRPPGNVAVPVDVDTLNESAPLVFDSRDITAEGYSKALCLQTECYPGATHGEQTPITLILAVDVV